VKEIFTANCGEAPDLSWTQAFESHPRAAAGTEIIESPVVIKPFLPLIGQSSIFNLAAIFEMAVGRTKRVRTPHGGFRDRPGAGYPGKPCSRRHSGARQAAHRGMTVLDCFVADAPRNDGALSVTPLRA
jgi:hypothetical protein